MEITHSVSEGTVLNGTSRGDGTAGILKELGWRWGRSISCWYLPQSRERRADAARIEACRTRLTDEGFDVQVRVDDTMPATSDLEQSRIERQQRRVDALAARSTKAQQAADAAHTAAGAAADRLPPGGEPIHIGHHSEGRHRRDIERARKSFNKALEADQKAAQTSQRLQAASHTTGARYAPQTVARRIAKIEADFRATRRSRRPHHRPRHLHHRNPARRRHAPRPHPGAAARPH